MAIGDRWFVTDGDRTELEAGFLALCRRHRIPNPEVNVKVDRFEVDFLWRRVTRASGEVAATIRELLGRSAVV